MDKVDLLGLIALLGTVVLVVFACIWFNEGV